MEYSVHIYNYTVVTIYIVSQGNSICPDNKQARSRPSGGGGQRGKQFPEFSAAGDRRAPQADSSGLFDAPSPSPGRIFASFGYLIEK
jgi:hypothetical protein